MATRYQILVSRHLVKEPSKQYPCEGFGGPCDRKDATRNRQNTQYSDEERNWAVLCPECQKASNEHWADRWADYYSMVR